jgi:predicted metal-dependent HD superfamily phosphohydrolase
MNELQKHWDLLMSRLRNPLGAPALWRELTERHTERHRSYHNLNHVLQMLNGLEDLGVINPEISLAIWFHDAIYDPKSSSNEAWSAKLAAMRIVDLGLSERLAGAVHSLIIATSHREPPTSHDAELLVDLDLMILGQSPEEFMTYEQQIRREYSWVDEATFRQKRIEILQRFLDREQLYSTYSFQRTHEQQARVNLTLSIARLAE